MSSFTHLSNYVCIIIIIPWQHLHSIRALTAFVGEEILRPYMTIINLNPDETPPQDKIYQNTVLAVPVELSISQRKPMLNRFLEEIIKNSSITKQHIFLEFIDQFRKGVPGCVRILKQSGEEILWQKMTNTNKPTFMIDFYPLWSIKYDSV